MSQDSSSRSQGSGDELPADAKSAGSETTAPGPHSDSSPPTDNVRGWTEASPAGDVTSANEPRSEGTAVAEIEERSPVVEPAHDQTGVQIINPGWVYTGYWGPLDEAQHPAVVALRAQFGDAIEEVTFFRDEVTVRVRAESLAEICTFLRDAPDLKYQMLSDLTAVDMLNLREEPRFDVVVTLYSIPRRWRLRLKAGVREGQPCPTLTTVFAAAGWFERECYDMFGIVFAGHPDLRRMLLPEDWDEGHPLRKDYPIRGYKQYVQPGFAAVPRIRETSMEGD